MAEQENNIVDFTALKEKRDAVKAETLKALESNSLEPVTSAELLVKLVEVIDAQDKVTGMLLHDMMVLAKKLEMVEVTNFNNAASLQVVVTILKEKFPETVTQEDFQTIWQRDVVPQLKELQEQQQATTEPESNIIKPTPNIIIP